MKGIGHGAALRRVDTYQLRQRVEGEPVIGGGGGGVNLCSPCWAAKGMGAREMVMAVSKRRSIESPSEGFPTTRRIRGVLTAILIREGY